MSVLSDLAALEAAATPGPWETDPAFLCSVGAIGAEGSEGEWSQIVADFEDKEDAALIAAARNALPALLAVAQAAQSVRDSRQITADDAHLEHSLDLLGEALAALEAGQ